MTDDGPGVTAMVVTAAEWDTLLAERDAFAAALAAATHTYEPLRPNAHGDSCDAYVAVGDGRELCCGLPGDPVHQTPAAVRARIKAGAA